MSCSESSVWCLISPMTNTFEISVGDLLSSNRRERIVVPTFQRGYEWGKKHVEAFWKDITDFQDERASQTARKRHFFGPIVVLQKTDGEWELLDGQQRLATATILFSVLRDAAQSIPSQAANYFALDTQQNFILKTDGQTTLQLGETDKTYFKETIQTFPPSPLRSKIRTQRNIASARQLLSAKLDATIGQSAPQAKLSVLRELRQTLISDLTVACIPVESERDAFMIFETLNDRGLRLAAPDLLLNLLMRKSNDADRATIRSLWTDMIESLGQFDLKEFLRHFWVSKHGDIKKTDLFTVLRDHIESGKTDPVSFVRACAEECDPYIYIVGVDKNQLAGAVDNVHGLIVELNSDASVPLLLSGYQKFSIQDFEKVCGWMLVFITRYAIMANQERAGVENIFYRLAREVREMMAPVDGEAADATACLAKIKEALVNNAPLDDQITPEKFTLNPVEARYVMARLAAYMQSQNNELETTSYANIEHIYPKNPKEGEWGGPDNQEKMDEYLWHIGNLTVLSKGLNAKTKNSEFSIKKSHYLKSDVEMTLRVARDFDKWDVQTIQTRAANLTRLSKEIWMFTNLSRV